MTDLEDLPFTNDDGRKPNGAKGRKPGRNPNPDPVIQRRCANNRQRGNRAELDIARSIPGGRKMGPLGLPWDVEVGTYARLQVKKLARRPGPAEIARLIGRIPDTGDRLRGFVWVEAAGRGKRGQRVVWFPAYEFRLWHGSRQPEYLGLVSMALDEWVAEFVRPSGEAA